MKPRFNNLPLSLQQKALFCLWRYELDQKGRKTKVPYNPNRPRQKADSTNKNTFSSFDKVVEIFFADSKFDGIGVGVFDFLCGIDIDNCIDEHGNIDERAQEIIDVMKSYTEISPSGTGVRILCLRNKDFKYNTDEFYIKHGNLEIYVSGSTNRFLTVTGNVIRLGELEDRTYELLTVATKFMRRKRSDKTATAKTTVSERLPNDEIIRKAADAANGDTFRKLWSGDTSDYPSESEADLALCNLLAFWTGKNADQMDTLFRQSGLYREKWNSKRGGNTYGGITIIKAIEGCSDVYKKNESLEPTDYTDIGQSEVFVREYGSRLRYSAATKYLVYDGKRWIEDELNAQRLSQELTARQLVEAKERINRARNALDAALESDDQDAAKAAKGFLKREEKFRTFVLGRRSSSKIKATMAEAAPRIKIEVGALDADGYLLNTPDGTVDLRTGQIHEHRPKDYCTKITAASPGTDGADIFAVFLDEITVHDSDLARYLQDISGLCAIGVVKREELIIIEGEGSNGKSTFFNLIFRVLGDYAGMLSAETLTTTSRKNKSPEYAELRGKRLIIAAELEESERLDTSVVKKLCSTDPILAEKKYKDPFVFVPSHHVILYTNHLPKVGTNDNGTWRRLVTVPFKARFEEGKGQIKDYASYLFEHCAGAVLTWIIEGAKRVIGQEFNISKPDCVKDAIKQYREESDWLAAFIADRCEICWTHTVTGGVLYDAYKNYCEDSGEFLRNRHDFVNALEAAGYEGRKTKAGKVYKGLSVISFTDRFNRDRKAENDVSLIIQRENES